jgi:hypothetical protein
MALMVMQVRNVLKIALVVLVLLTGPIAPLMASNNQSNQAMDRPAILISPEPSFEIGVYPKPSSSPKRIGFGLGGDRLTLIEQVGSNEGDTWDYVRFENPKQIEGWVKDEFVALQEGDRFVPKVQNAPSIRPNLQPFNPQGNSFGGKQSFASGRNSYQQNPQQNYGQQNQYP